MARIVNLKHEPTLALSLAHYPVHSGTVLTDRRTQWDNPFLICEHGSREQAVERYRRDLWRVIRAGEINLQDLAALADMRLDGRRRAARDRRPYPLARRAGRLSWPGGLRSRSARRGRKENLRGLVIGDLPGHRRPQLGLRVDVEPP